MKCIICKTEERVIPIRGSMSFGAVGDGLCSSCKDSLREFLLEDVENRVEVLEDELRELREEFEKNRP